MPRLSLATVFTILTVFLWVLGALYVVLFGRDRFTHFLGYGTLTSFFAAFILSVVASQRARSRQLAASADLRARDRRGGMIAWPGVAMIVGAIGLMGFSAEHHKDTLFSVGFFALMGGAAMIVIGAMIG